MRITIDEDDNRYEKNKQILIDQEQRAIRKETN